MTCHGCHEDFDAPNNYFWELVGDDVQCPHCGAWNETDWDEGEDSVIGPWTTGLSDYQDKKA